ncbi:MAG TPA: hypothetical protein V6C97_30395, partial [Oculatellaceae cyanobacterium]
SFTSSLPTQTNRNHCKTVCKQRKFFWFPALTYSVSYRQRYDELRLFLKSINRKVVTRRND